MSSSRLGRPLAWPIFLLAVVLAVTSCVTDQVVVATLQSCATNEDCPATDYCDKPTCADPIGSCKLRPMLCEVTMAARCGCDGTTYWNDCLRMQRGVAASTADQCFAADGNACSSAETAPDECKVVGASCARLVSNGPLGDEPDALVCPADLPGACWVLPPDCAGTAAAERWLACDGSSACDDTCTAIRSGVPHRHDFAGGCR